MQRTLRVLFVATLVGSVLAATLGAFPRAWAGTEAGEPAITAPGPAGDYLRHVHERIHARWAEDFLKSAPSASPPGTKAPPSGSAAAAPAATHGPVASDPRPVTVALTIRWDGTVADTILRSSSGVPEIDRAAILAARKGAPFPLPTSDVLSDDGYAHFEWTFARDHRACSGGKLARQEDPLEVALPRLVRSNRTGEALRRVGEAGAGRGRDGGVDALDRFARLYLSRSMPDPLLDTAASVALAGAGDKVQADRLRAALGSRATVQLAARGLQKLGIDVCDVVRAPLEGAVAFDRDTAFEAVRAVAASGTNIASCRPSLELILRDGKQARATRLAAFELLDAHFAAELRPLLTVLMTDKDGGVKGAAVMASVRKGAGRPEMYRLAPFLRDKAVEVRAAASAGMVRAGGDLALDQLYRLARETDPRPAQMVAAELATHATSATAEFLGQMLKRDNREVQIAALQALMARKDREARALVEETKTSPQSTVELRRIASGGSVRGPVASVSIEGDSARVPASGDASTTAVAAGAPAATAPDLVAYKALLERGRSREAVAWVLQNLLRLPPRTAVDVLGDWLVRDAIAAAAAPGAAPAPAAASAAPAGEAKPAPSSTPAPAAAATSALAL